MQNMSDMLQELKALRAENQQLPQLLEAHGIAIPDTAEKEDVAIPEIPTAVTKRSPLADKITLFMFLFLVAQMCTPAVGKAKMDVPGIVQSV